MSLERYLPGILADATIAELPNHYAGKVRDNYDLPDGRRVIIATDRLSAFDRPIAVIPLKGLVLTQIARFWFDATADIAVNHVLAYPDPNVLIGKRLAILPVEMVVRDYLAGTTSTSILRHYQEGRRDAYGVRLPDGLVPHERLPETIITPTTKALAGAHDEPLTPAQIVESGLLSEAQWHEVAELSLRLFARGRDMAAARGLILADTKYEFGVDEAGTIYLADEIHTPDSSRYWLAETYEARLAAGAAPDSFDKDQVRAWVRARCDPYRDPIPRIPDDIVLGAASRYIGSYERLTGRTLDLPPPGEPVLDRVRRAVLAYLGTG